MTSAYLARRRGPLFLALRPFGPMDLVPLNFCGPFLLEGFFEIGPLPGPGTGTPARSHTRSADAAMSMAFSTRILEVYQTVHTSVLHFSTCLMPEHGWSRSSLPTSPGADSAIGACVT